VNNVVFPCGLTLGSDGDTINMYYGAADTSIALATGSLKTLMDWIDEYGKPVHQSDMLAKSEMGEWLFR
jgi:predicted GH43/DUF377 family glycosyl hydrolase